MATALCKFVSYKSPDRQLHTWPEGLKVTFININPTSVILAEDCGGSILRMLPASRLRLSRFAVGDQVEYWSTTSKSLDVN